MKREDAVIVAAYAIEDIFCQAFPGRWERLKAVQAEIAKLVERISPEAAAEIATLRDHRLARAASQPSPIPPSDSVAPPCAVPASPPAVESSPAVPPEDMPIPQPAPRPAVQDEAPVNQGKDQRAQKEETVAAVALAGAAQAGHLNADPCNSSRPAEVGPVLIPAGRTKPAITSKPYDPRPGRLTGVTITAPGTVVAVDTVNFVVACPGGDWQTSRPVALIMERMRNGEMFGNDILATVGNLPPSVFAESKHRWAEELAKRGVNFIHIKGVGCKIEIAGASA